MRFHFERFCLDHGIDIAPDGHKHGRPGWIQIACPFCTGNPGFHLGYEIVNNRFHCWRCGPHLRGDVVMKLTKCELPEAMRIVNRSYKIRSAIHVVGRGKEPRIRRPFRLPKEAGPMGTNHRRYLAKRKFDADLLEKLWELQGTGIHGELRFRILAPIYFEGQMVTYQTRDITDRASKKYLACEQEYEVRAIKDCLYGLDLVPRETVVVCEGITDVWRLGPGAVATFGIGYTNRQVLLLKRFKKRFIFFDSVDPQAVESANRLASSLSAFDGVTEVIETDDADPGSMSQTDANSLMKKINLRGTR